MSKTRPPFVPSKIMNLVVSFLDFEPKKCFLEPDSIGFAWSGVGRALMQFMQFLVVFAMACFWQP